MISIYHSIYHTHTHVTKIAPACSFGWWPVVICSERKVFAGWFVRSEREKYWWLTADKPKERTQSTVRF
jgi:hypothetical protein